MMDIGNKMPSSWPKLLDMTKDECRKALRALELTTYSQVVSVLRAQGELTKEKRKLLNDLQAIFSITLERHRAEIRRAVNDEKLTTIADTLAGPNTEVEWAVEGRRLVPLMPRLPPQTPYTALATRMALIYYGLNATMPPPNTTAMYGKMDELGGNSDDTDSEEETDGLRFLPGSMVPPQYNADHGNFTTLPYSHTRLAKMPPKEIREVTSTTAGTTTTTSTSLTSGGSSMTGPMAMGVSGAAAGDKRKRKRSASTDHALPPPPPPPPPREFPSTPGTPTKQMGGVGRTVGGTAMKITVPVTGNVTRGSTATPVSTIGSHTQKVILVSTSGASGVGGGVYQRSLSVPVMKSSTSSPATPSVMRGVPSPAPSSLATPPQIQSGGSGSMIVPSTYPSGTPLVTGAMPPSGTYGNRMRPRVPSSQPARPRQRSNSLADNPPHRGTEQGSSVTLSSGGHITSLPTFPQGATSPSLGPHNITQPHPMTHQTIQVRPSSVGTPGKTAIQIRQEGSAAKIITHTVGGNVGGLGGGATGLGTTGSLGMGPPSTCGRTVGRPSATTSPQVSAAPLFVSNPSSITVVTRTVAAGQGTGPRVVTVNTVNTPKSSAASGMSLSRSTSTPATVVSVGPKTIQTVRVTPQGPVGLRPVLGSTGIGSGGKSNVIVVHKGAPPPPGTRPVTIQGISRDPPTKITIGKPLGSGAATAVLQKPQTTLASIARCGTITTTATSTNVTQAVPTTSQGGNVIVVDLSPERANITTTAALTDLLQGTVNSSNSFETTTTTATTTTTVVTTSTTSSTTTSATTTFTKNASGGSGSGDSAGGSGSGGESEGEWLNLRLEGDDSPAHSLPEGQMQMLEEAVEILGRGDKESARNLLRQAGIELLDSPGDVVDHSTHDGSSMASIMAGLASQLPGGPGHLGEGTLPVVGELDPATGLFNHPTSSDSSSDSNSNSASDDLEGGEDRDAAE